MALWKWLPDERVPRATRLAEPSHKTSRGFVLRGSPALFRNRRLVATFGVGFCVLFTQVAMFTYVTFHLAAPPFGLSTVALGWLFVVYLVGAVVTPLGGRWIDAHGHRVGHRRRRWRSAAAARC